MNRLPPLASVYPMMLRSVCSARRCRVHPHSRRLSSGQGSTGLSAKAPCCNTSPERHMSHPSPWAVPPSVLIYGEEGVDRGRRVDDRPQDRAKVDSAGYRLWCLGLGRGRPCLERASRRRAIHPGNRPPCPIGPRASENHDRTSDLITRHEAHGLSAEKIGPAAPQTLTFSDTRPHSPAREKAPSVTGPDRGPDMRPARSVGVRGFGKRMRSVTSDSLPGPQFSTDALKGTLGICEQ